VPRLVELADEEPRRLWHGLICLPIEGGGLFGPRETLFALAFAMRRTLSFVLHIVSTDGIIIHIH
jgi:hypothetical protein